MTDLPKKSPIRLGFALSGSFCTFSAVLEQLEQLATTYDILPIMSATAYATDTRFGKAEEFIRRIETACGHHVLHTVTEVEPIGPKKLLDALVIAPCTGTTVAKLALGISDTPVTLAAKAHLRNARPLILAVSSNDALGANAKNIGQLFNMRHIYFVPFAQDDALQKPTSLVARMDQLPATLEAALRGEQLQPMIL